MVKGQFTGEGLGALKMYKKAQLLFEITVIFTLTAGRGAAYSAESLGILAFGDIRGHMEPCGCDPRTDVGGVRRIAAAVSRYRSQDPKVAVVNLGNIAKPSESTSLRMALNQILEVVKPEVSLINVYEWESIHQKTPLANIKWVLSNSTDQSSKKSWALMERVGDLEFFGYLGLKDKNLLKVNKLLFDRWRKKTKVPSKRQRVLLFSGSDQELSSIVKADFFGEVIRSSKVPLGVKIGDEEQKNERLLTTSINKDLIWAVPYGGTGLLRVLGLERSAPPKPISTLLRETAKQPQAIFFSKDMNSEIPSITKSLTFIHWLRKEEESGISLGVSRIFDKLKQSEKEIFRQLVEIRSRNLENTEYVGSEACMGCHSSSYEIWKRSKHATAINTLIKQNRHEDVNCVECHVLGFKSDGGYVNQQLTPQFANVQCESCHGPRREHVMMPGKKNNLSSKIDPKKSCAECHTPPHSPGFNSDSYWKSIEHK
jgi:hypothetical protein